MRDQMPDELARLMEELDDVRVRVAQAVQTALGELEGAGALAAELRKGQGAAPHYFLLSQRLPGYVATAAGGLGQAYLALEDLRQDLDQLWDAAREANQQSS
jgi:hypothetical protein